LNDADRWQADAPWAGDTAFDVGGKSAPERLSLASSPTTNETLMYGFYNSTTNSVQELWKNGSLADSDATASDVGAVGGQISIGASGAAFQYCDMAEFIVINGTITTNDRERLEGYLAWKWGQVVSLPNDHTYKNRAPMI
jgi:hypothetical protein